jgi:hypothetical protein
MPFLPTSRTRRNLFKVASLGLAGLLAGLLAGCNDADASVSYAKPQTSNLPKSIEATQIPALRHPPSSRSLQYHTVAMSASSGRNRS